jgi:hypothetical protein
MEAGQAPSQPRQICASTVRVLSVAGATIGVVTDEVVTDEPAPQEAGPALAGLVLDYLDPTAIGVDAEAGTMPPLVYECLKILGAASLRPSETRLVLSGDFVASVRDRLPDGPNRDNYDTARGDGIVAGKTMTLDDGRIDVVMPAGVFVPVEDDTDADEERILIVIRTISHEAQHVAMGQGGESDATDYAGEAGWARRNFLVVADQVIGEYRAEAAVARALRSALTWEPVDILRRVRNDLRRIALVDYQQHLDAGRLSQEAGQEAHTAWKLLAYVVAAHRKDDGTFDDVPSDVLSDPLWDRMAGRHWSRFVEILGSVPPGSERIGRADLAATIDELATALQAWFVDFGFEWDDHEAGNTSFFIVGWDLLEPTSM